MTKARVALNDLQVKKDFTLRAVRSSMVSLKVSEMISISRCLDFSLKFEFISDKLV